MSIRGPWYITQKALEDYLDITGHTNPHRASEAELRRAEEALMDAAQDAVDSGRIPQELDSGALRYRGPAPARLSLVVSSAPRKEGSLPQLVSVTCDGRARRMIRQALGIPPNPGPGRPEGTRKVSEPGKPHGGEPIMLRLSPELAGWVRGQEGGAQAYLRRLIERDLVARSRPTLD